jgi:hypothetical protein
VVTELTSLGTTVLILNYGIAFALMYYVGEGNAPEKRPVKSLRSLIVGRVFFAVMLALMASSPTASGGLFSIVNPIASAVKSLGAYYFIVALVLDMVLASLFYSLEYYKAFAVTLANLPSIPFVTAIASLIAVLEQKSTISEVRKDVETGYKHPAAVLGTVSKSVRLVEQPIRASLDDAQLKTHILVRRIPGRVKVMYCPVIGDRDFNPHMIIAGASGAGKTTTTYSLITQLMEHYPVILFDVKGDFTEAFYGMGHVDEGRAVVYMVSATGIDPFKPVVEGETETQMVEDLMDSISVLEEVGSKQAHFIREAYAELRHYRKPLTYENLVERMKKLEGDVIEGRVKYGPQTKDAIEGIYDKLHDLSTVFKSSGAGLRELYAPLFEDGSPKLVVLNISEIGEKTRAIVLEFMLRKLAKVMAKRGPLAFTRGKPVVTVIDEAYLVTKPILLRGGRDSGSRSKLEDIARTARSYGLALILVTQRLADVADGIRQSCYRWIVFNTSSPEDMWILSQTAPDSIRKIIADLDKGEAYIKCVVSARQRTFSRQDAARIIVDGYIFQMRREMLTPVSAEPPKPCPVCGRVMTREGRCLIQHEQEERRELKQAVAETTQSEEVVEEKPEEGGGEFVESYRVTAAALTAWKLAIIKTKDQQAAKALENIPETVVVKFCENWRDEKFREQFIANGLLRIDGGKLKKTLAGSLLLKFYQEVYPDV